MSPNAVQMIRRLAVSLIIAIGATVVGLLSFQTPSATANTYVGSQNGSDANSSSMVIDYVWGTNNEVVSIGLLGPVNLEAVWTNTVTSASFTVTVSNPVSNTNSTIIQVTTPTNTWSAGVKVQLEIRPRAGASSFALAGINNSVYTQQRLFEVRSFGNFQPFTSLSNAFWGTTAQARISAQLPATVTNLSGAFAQTTFNGALSGWSTSNVLLMAAMFSQASAFNQSIGNWDVSNVQTMELMFSNATAFNQQIGNWTVSNVTNMRRMFFNANQFNQPIGNWDVSKVETMDNMFYLAERFNQNISNWNVSRVQNMISMFEAASRFNNGEQTTSPSVSGTAPLNWQTPSLSSATRMFAGASVFNQNVNSMNLSQVTDLTSVFSGAAFFNNGDAAGSHSGNTDVRFTWTTSNVTKLTDTFKGATNFNQDLNSWDTSKVTDLKNTFQSASQFNNGDAPGTTSNVVMTWNTANVTDMSYMFNGGIRFNQDLNSWNTAKVTTLQGTFQGATDFNNGDSTTSNTANASVSMSWSLSSLANLNSTFMLATSFNQDLNGWNTSKITTLFASFQSATSFNNGDGPTADSTNTNVEMTWNLAAATTLNSAFFGATSFNQDLNSWVLPKAGQMGTVLRNASRFNNGDPAGAHETDGVNQVAMTWSLSGTTDLSWAFSGATVFNQNISSWNVSSVSNLSYFAGSDSLTDSHFNNGASSTSQNVWNWTTSSLTNLSFAFAGLQRFNADISSWDTSKVTSLRQTFVKASRFNQDISRWTTSAVTDMSNTFALATAFNQPIGRWNVSNVTEMSGMFSTARSFNQDLSNWGPFQAGNNMLGMFMDAQNMNDSPKNWDMSWAPVGSSKLQYFFGNLSAFTTSDMALSVSKSILRGWSFQKVNRQSSVGFFKGPLYANCEEWSSYERLRLRSWTFQGVGGYTPAAPTCTSVTVTWSPTSTYSASFGSITPDVMATTNGPSGVKYAVHSAGTSRCRVNPDTGVISHSISGSCEIIAYDAGQNSNTAVQPGYRIAVFSLPTPQFPATPTAPIINSTRADSGAIAINFGAPSTSGTAPLGGYEVGYSLTQGGSKTWVTVSPVVTSSPTLSYTLSGLVNGTNYWLVVRGFNSNGVGSSSPEVGPVQPAPPISTASQPIIFSVNKPGDSSNATIEFLAPASDGGDPISGYEIRFSTNEGVSWGAWQSASATLNPSTQRWVVSLSGLQGSALLPSYYIFEVRARNSVGVSAASTQIPSGAPINSVSFGNQSATVSFRAARYDGNSPILGYEYMLREGPSSSPTSVSSWISISSTIWQQATATTTASFALTGLTNGNTYTVWVRAVNALGGLTTEYQNWLNNTGVPNKAIASLSFSYGVSAISFSPNASYSPNVTTNSDGSLSYSSLTPSLCSVNTSTGLVSNLNAGSCVIRVTVAEGSNHLTTSVSATIITTKASQPTLVVTPSSTSAIYLNNIYFSYSGGAGTGLVSTSVSSSSGCAVSGNVVTMGSVGTTCLVLVTKNGDANYLAGDTIQVSLTSLKASQAAVNLSNASSMTSRETLVLSAVGGSGSGAFNYLVTNAGTAGCSLTGRNLVATSSGTCQIAASRAESQNYFVSATVSMTITVSKTAQTIRFTTDVPATPLAGGTYSPTVTASSGLTPSITATGSCAISAGVVTFNASGDCFIEASQAGDSVWLAASSVSQTIAVGRRNQTLTFQPTTNQIATKTFGDQAFQIQAVSSDPAATVSYTLSPQTTNNACDVIGNGLVIVQNVGDCVILAYSLQTAELAAASTISKRIEIKPDFASAPFVTSVAMSNLAINVGLIPPSYFGGSSISAFSLVAESQGQSPATSVSSTACLPTVSGNVSCRISGLQNGVTYRVKVAGINGAGVGEYSALSPSITVATNPAAVQNLRVVQGAATLAISWDDPESLGGGTFSAYRVYVKKSSTSSYNTEHYFNVTNAATRNITISAETPPDGMGYLGGPTLSNGVAYDIKVVTVTTANAEELTGNTAVMNQIPRTVPDPPRLANALVVGNKLVLTWTAPISDGGAAVTTYSASVGSSPCTFANPTDTFCEIALPTAPGNYVFAIAAQNVAGSSTEIQGVFTVVSYNSNTPTTTGGNVVTEPAKPSESAPVISSVSFSVDGKQIFIRGTFLKGISKVVIGGVEARIVSQTSEMIIVTAPKLAAGSHAVLLHLTDKTVLRYEKELVVKGTKPAPVVKKTAKITGFKPGSAVLSTAMKNSLIKIFKANKGSKTLQCIGHTQGPSILKSDARLAMKRAVAVCNFAKKQGIKVVSSSYQNNKKVGSQFRRVDLIFTR